MSKLLLDLKSDEQAISISESLKVFYKRQKGIVVAPTETMKSLFFKPNLLFPILLMIIVIIGTLLINTAPYKEYSKGEILKSNIQNKIEMSAEKVDQEITKNSIIRLFIIPMISILIWLAGSAILFIIIKALKGSGNFKEFLIITGYAYIIIIFGGILQSIVVQVTGKYVQTFDISSLAYYLPKSLKGNFFYGVASGIEVFKLWNYYVVGIGVCYISKLSKAKVYMAIATMIIWPLVFGGMLETMTTMVK